MTYLTSAEAALILRMSRARVCRLAHKGDLRGSKESNRGGWRFTADDLDAWVERHSNLAPGPQQRRRRRRRT